MRTLTVEEYELLCGISVETCDGTCGDREFTEHEDAMTDRLVDSGNLFTHGCATRPGMDGVHVSLSAQGRLAMACYEAATRFSEYKE